MSLTEDNTNNGADHHHHGGYRWWALATSAQLAIGVATYRKGSGGDSRFMPFKAFVIASLIVGAGATSVAGFLNASGIHKVEDLKKAGANIRNGSGIRPSDVK